MKSDIQIAQEAKMEPIVKIAEEIRGIQKMILNCYMESISE